MNIKNNLPDKRYRLYNLLRIPIGTPEFLDAKFLEHRTYTIRMLWLTALVASGLWVWDYAHDPAHAVTTWIPRMMMGIFPAICAMAMALFKPPRIIVQWAIMVSSILEAIFFFIVTTRINGGIASGNEGYMFNQIAVLLIMQGCSFPVIIAGHVASTLMPHMMALAFPGAGFIHVKYAILLWPVTGAILIAQYFMYVQYGQNWRLRQKLEEMASHDTLTGFLNRRAFLEHAIHLVTLAKRHWNQHLCILMIDADYFKRINDTYGHHVGDRALRELSSTIRKNLRNTDLQCRWGGEEFIILMPDTDMSGAWKFSERLLQAVRSLQINTGLGAVTLTVSIGIAELNDIKEELDELISRADNALYLAKSMGRDRVERSI